MVLIALPVDVGIAALANQRHQDVPSDRVDTLRMGW